MSFAFSSIVLLFIIPDTKLRGFANLDLYFSSKTRRGIINSPRTTMFGSVGNWNTGNK